VPAGRVDGDALHRVAAAVQLVLHLPRAKVRIRSAAGARATR
jgi:hypothetical protein